MKRLLPLILALLLLTACAAEAAPEGSAEPTPVPTPVPYAITVDVRNQVTTVYGLDENGEYTVPVKQMVCSTGMKATPSDVGEWVLNGRKARWCYFPTWGSHAQYWTRINENIAFHSVIYNTVDLNNMSTKSYRLLGSRASHGCIRLLVSDAKWIYDNCVLGTKVYISPSKLSSPLEKPTGIKLPYWHTWDPTDPTAYYMCQRNGCH